MRDLFLLGYNKDEDVFCFADVRLRDENGKTVFSASFDTVRPLREDKWKEEISCVWDPDELDYETFTELIKQYECAPSVLIDRMMAVNDVTELLDCSLFPERYLIDRQEYVFISEGCGQQDLTATITHPYNHTSVREIIRFWKEHHLKEITESEQNELDGILDKLTDDSRVMCEWITDVIRTERSEQ